MNPFGVEHEPLSKAWAGAVRQSKKAETTMRAGRLKQRQRGTRLDRPRSRNFTRQVVDDIVDGSVSSRQPIDAHYAPDATENIYRTVRPYIKQRQGKVREKDINGIDIRGKVKDTRDLRYTDPHFYRSK